MQNQQSISNPFGITVFGSSTIRVAPDVASLRFSVSRLNKKPKDAFAEARSAAKAINQYLSNANIQEVGTSRISLKESYDYALSKDKLLGYTASISFNVILRDLNRIEEILVGVTDAGANNINEISFQTSQLKEYRADARKQAIAAAREKGILYCEAAGVRLGRVLHIEDVNPDQLRGREGHRIVEISMDESDKIQAFDPGSISIGGAVMMGFEIGSD